MKYVVASATGVLMVQQVWAGVGTACVNVAGPRVRTNTSILANGAAAVPTVPDPPADYFGAARMKCQIVVSNLSPGDGVTAFTSTQFGVGPGGTGRLNPFAVPSMLASSPSGELTIFVENDGTQRRIAGANATTMLTNLDYGIRMGQAPRYIAEGDYDGSDVANFIRFEVVIGSTPGPRDIYLSIPYESILEGRIYYYSNFLGTTEGFIDVQPETLTPTIIHVVECPSDFNVDDGVDFFDYLDFVDAFSSGGDGADYNNDSIVDFSDYLDFVVQFSTGC